MTLAKAIEDAGLSDAFKKNCGRTVTPAAVAAWIKQQPALDGFSTPLHTIRRTREHFGCGASWGGPRTTRPTRKFFMVHRGRTSGTMATA